MGGGLRAAFFGFLDVFDLSLGQFAVLVSKIRCATVGPHPGPKGQGGGRPAMAHGRQFLGLAEPLNWKDGRPS